MFNIVVRFGSFADIEVCIINVCFASKADILHHGFCVRFVPIADTCIMYASCAARRAFTGPAAVMLLNPTYGKRGLHPTRDTCGPGGA
jgi:hypothetical protein